MSGLLPFETEVTWGGHDEPRVLDLESDDADEVFSVLSSTTARRILLRLYDEPGTASDLSRDLDTSLQNVDYHLGNLRGAALVEVVDTWYSEKGREMKVYAPADRAVVVFAGRSPVERVRSLLTGALGVVLLVGVAGVALRSAIGALLARTPAAGDSGGPGVAREADTAAGTPASTPGPTLEGLDALPLVLDPAVLFVLGGVFALLVVGVWWYVRRTRRDRIRGGPGQ